MEAHSTRNCSASCSSFTYSSGKVFDTLSLLHEAVGSLGTESLSLCSSSNINYLAQGLTLHRQLAGWVSFGDSLPIITGGRTILTLPLCSALVHIKLLCCLKEIPALVSTCPSRWREGWFIWRRDSESFPPLALHYWGRLAISEFCLHTLCAWQAVKLVGSSMVSFYSVDFFLWYMGPTAGQILYLSLN